MKWAVDIAAKVLTALAAFFAIKRYGKLTVEKENLEDAVEDLKEDAKIDAYYSDLDLSDAAKRMREKVRKHATGIPRTK